MNPRLFRMSLRRLIAAVLVACGWFGPSASAETFVRIENREDSTKQLNVETGALTASATKPGWHSADWVFEPISTDVTPRTYRIRNRYKATYLNIEKGVVESSSVPPAFVSGQWAVEPVEGTSFFRIRNLWIPSYLSIENGALVCAKADPAALKVQWSLKTAREPGTSYIPDWQKGVELCKNFKSQWAKLKDLWPDEGEVENTYYAGILETYTAGVNHVQGIAWSGTRDTNKLWAITHDISAGSGKNLLMLCSDPTDKDEPGSKPKTKAHFVGKYQHPGGALQIMGDVLITSDEATFPRLYDLRDGMDKLTELPCRFPDAVTVGSKVRAVGGSAAIAWDPITQSHIVMFDCSGDFMMFKSNGKPLDDFACVFQQMTGDLVHTAGEGLSQLFYDPVTKKLVAIGGSNNQLSYQYFTVDSTSLTLTAEDKETVECIGDATTRWGATVRMFSDGFDVVMADRPLSRGGAVDPDLLIFIYRPARPGETRVSFVNKGLYSSEYIITYVLNGENKVENSGTVLAGRSKTYFVPKGATYIGVRGDAFTGLPDPRKMIFDQTLPDEGSTKTFVNWGGALTPLWKDGL